jgi:hypothetical protein
MQLPVNPQQQPIIKLQPAYNPQLLEAQRGSMYPDMIGSALYPTHVVPDFSNEFTPSSPPMQINTLRSLSVSLPALPPTPTHPIVKPQPVSPQQPMNPQGTLKPPPKPLPATPPKPQKEVYKALYDFEATEDNELPFKKGDVVTLVKKYDDSEW